MLDFIFIRLLIVCTGFSRVRAAALPEHFVESAAEVPESLSTDIASWEDYETGQLGLYPKTKYQSTTASSPRIHVQGWSDLCDSHSYTFLAPHGDALNDNKAYLVDARGQLVWHHVEKGSIHNFKMQKYKGRDYITYWVGNDEFWYHGHGYYKMIDDTYTLAHVVNAANGLDGDYHEFSITVDDTALITTFTKLPWDLSSKGRTDGWIWDTGFQEIDIESGAVLFEWRASAHYDIHEMHVNSWSSWTGTSGDPWDWHHITSVQKDSHGNFLAAAKYTSALTYIDGQSGEIIWEIGGKNLRGQGASKKSYLTTFDDPYTAQWENPRNPTTLMVFHKDTQGGQQVSVGTRISVSKHHHLPNMPLNATTIQTIRHPRNMLAAQEGSFYRLDNGNYYIGYGSTPVYSEFTPDGEMQCDTNYAPMRTQQNGTVEAASNYVQTYRTYKATWRGFPLHLPSVRYDDQLHSIAWSWNGATEVKHWNLEGKRYGGSWAAIGTYKSAGFETVVDLHGTSYSSFRLSGFGDKQILGSWLVLPGDKVHKLALRDARPFMTEELVIFGFAILMLMAFRTPFKVPRAVLFKSQKRVKL